MVMELCYSRWLVCFFISRGEMVSQGSSRRCKLRFTENHQDYIYIFSYSSKSLANKM